MEQLKFFYSDNYCSPSCCSIIRTSVCDTGPREPCASETPVGGWAESSGSKSKCQASARLQDFWTEDFQYTEKEMNKFRTAARTGSLVVLLHGFYVAKSQYG